MKELQICLENCDMIKVPWESVVNLSIYKVHKTYHFSKNMNLEMLVADDVLLTLSKDADLPYQEFGVGKFTTNFKRLYDYVVGVDKENICKLVLRGIHGAYSYDPPSETQISIVSKVYMVLSKNADLQHKKWGICLDGY